MHAMSDWMRITDRNGVILKFKYKKYHCKQKHNGSNYI